MKHLCLVSVLVLAGCASNPYFQTGDTLSSFEAGKAAQGKGDLPLAISKYREAIKEDSGNCEAYVALGFTLLDSNATEEAMNTFERAVEKFPDNAPAHRGKGAVYLVIDQPESAAQELRKALSLNPQDHKALSTLGIAYDMLGQPEKAQANYRAALELEPMNMSYENNLALSLVLAGKFDEAIRVLERIARSPQATPRIRQNLALAYGLSGDMKKAKDMGRKDLDDRAMKNNIAYFEAVRSMPLGSGQVSGILPLNQPKRPYDSARSWSN
ncbi:tetratricopeptide repeat protein [Candidatus Bealeia paramacronuclearis]